MSNWYSAIEATVFTQIKYMLLKEYPTLNCTATSETTTPAKFPTLYLHEEQEETGQDLTNETINAVESTISIRVWTDTTESDCRAILTSATEELKRFHYNVKNLPTTKLSNKIAYGEIMAKRIIGGGDTEIVK